MRIKILTNTSAKIAELSEITQHNQKKYADRHGYEWQCEHFEYDTPQFNENSLKALHELKEHIKGVDVLMTVGADVMFMNQWIRIEDLLRPGDKVVIAKEKASWWPLNNDVMIWVNTPETLELVDRFIADFDIWKQYQWRLQQHLWNLIQIDQKVRGTVRIVEAQVMNQHSDHWQLGDFIMHFYGMPIAEKVLLAKKFRMLFPNYLPVYGGITDSHMPDVK